ncbi:hypothetical protein RRG08_016919 [Elysia crispata]|uniref:Uncharacterized protein n=1 Tax=Elysia crispata TaxID=231223 RepID=A0AAE0ZMB0_9GAST|nr:hypothetical protein RRG08_016919 [Elysia crispata]
MRLKDRSEQLCVRQDQDDRSKGKTWAGPSCARTKAMEVKDRCEHSYAMQDQGNGSEGQIWAVMCQTGTRPWV